MRNFPEPGPTAAMPSCWSSTTTPRRSRRHAGCASRSSAGHGGGSLPVWLELVRNGSSYTGYYSFDGSDWLTVGSATVPGQAATQDGGMFVTSHSAPGQVTFNGFSADGGTPQTLSLASTGNFNTIGTITVSLPLAAGTNTIEIGDPNAYTPDFDRMDHRSQHAGLTGPQLCGRTQTGVKVDTLVIP